MPRGELPADTDLEMAQARVAALIYWRVAVRQAPVEPDYLDRVTDTVLCAPRERSAGVDDDGDKPIRRDAERTFRAAIADDMSIEDNTVVDRGVAVLWVPQHRSTYLVITEVII